MVSKILTIFSLLLVAVFDVYIAEEIPDFIKVCHGNDPEIENCLKGAIEHLRPILAKGDPKYGIPILEPLDLGDLLVSDTARNGQGIRITATDILAYGASNFKVTKMKFNINEPLQEFEISLPALLTQGKYSVDGQVLLLPIKGSGTFTGNFTNCKGDVKIRGGIVERDGVKYVAYDKLSMKITVGKGRLHLDNLFGGDKLLGDVINEAINSNFDIVSRDIIPLIEKSLSALFLKIGNNIVEKFTFDQLFPTV